MKGIKQSSNEEMGTAIQFIPTVLVKCMQKLRLVGALYSILYAERV